VTIKWVNKQWAGRARRDDSHSSLPLLHVYLRLFYRPHNYHIFAYGIKLFTPKHLVDIGRIDSLAYIREEGNTIVIGALTTHIRVERSDLLRTYLAALPTCASLIGDQQVRNRGTIGGSLAQADPASDMLGTVLALKGEIIAQGPNGKRIIKADSFLTGPFATALEPNEILTEIRFAIPPAYTSSTYEKLANKALHSALAGCAASITLSSDGICTSASLVITGAATQISRASTAESALIGQQLNQATITATASQATDGLELISNIHATKDYRHHMVSVVTRRALQRALEQLKSWGHIDSLNTLNNG